MTATTGELAKPDGLKKNLIENCSLRKNENEPLRFLLR
jgi:hypothetical protein